VLLATQQQSSYLMCLHSRACLIRSPDSGLDVSIIPSPPTNRSRDTTYELFEAIRRVYDGWRRIVRVGACACGKSGVELVRLCLAVLARRAYNVIRGGRPDVARTIFANVVHLCIVLDLQCRQYQGRADSVNATYLCVVGVARPIAIDRRGVDSSRIGTGGRVEVVGRAGGPWRCH